MKVTPRTRPAAPLRQPFAVRVEAIRLLAQRVEAHARLAQGARLLRRPLPDHLGRDLGVELEPVGPDPPGPGLHRRALRLRKHPRPRRRPGHALAMEVELPAAPGEPGEDHVVGAAGRERHVVPPQLDAAGVRGDLDAERLRQDLAPHAQPHDRNRGTGQHLGDLTAAGPSNEDHAEHREQDGCDVAGEEGDDAFGVDALGLGCGKRGLLQRRQGVRGELVGDHR